MGEAPQNIAVARDGAAAFITLARPEKLNPLDKQTIKELRAAVADIDRDPTIRFVSITGEGRGFSAGGDLDGYISLYADPTAFRQFLMEFFDLLQAIETSEKIYIAAVNGVCVAGGIELLLACDLAIAADSARIGDGHLNFGQLPGAGGSQRLPRVVGPLWAKRLVLTGELLTAADAKQIGLITDVVPAAELQDRVRALIAGMLEKSPVGVRSAKHLLNVAASTEFAAGLAYELDFVHRYATTEFDATEGLIAFRDKRPPRFAS